MGLTKFWRLFRILVLLLLLAFVAPARAFIFDTFGDGFWTIINNGNGNTLVVNSAGASQAVATNTAFQQQFEFLYNEQDGTFRLRNHNSWLCIGALNASISNGTPVVTVANYTAAAAQKWNFVAVSSGVYQIVNMASGLALQTDNGSPANVTLQPVSADSYQYWHFAFQTHYPKKGLAGWDSQLPRFNASWLYNWGWGTSEGLSLSQVFAPMQWGNWGIGTLDANLSGPQEVLTFNEPDNTGQANMTVAQATNLWPALEALNLPLVSPAPTSPFGGWLGNFYSACSSGGLRVDYTAIHEYPEDTSASDLMNTLYSVWNTWGRAVWLTEFSIVNWDGKGTWSEESNYRFVAEFMWQAEGIGSAGGNEWLKRYSLFFFSGNPTANPWDGTGPTSDTFLNDNYTFTPLGELYAGWDADTTLRANIPYFIHNCATCFRMASCRNLSGPASLSIRHEDATVQWILTNAPDGNIYIQSLADGRRLRYSNSLLDLAPPGTTGSAVEWNFNGPDSNGYYFINNYNGTETLSANGSGGGISISIVPSGSPSDNTRFRFVKPYYSASLAPVTAPTGLAAAIANQSVTLNWTDSAPRYNVYRSTTSGGPYTRVVADLTAPFYTDNTAANGTTYYYVVTALDSLENESGYSGQAMGTPVSGANQGLVAEYKFENGVQDTSGNGFNGTLSPQGVTGYVPGQVDNYAINFSGGDDSYVTIPNPVGNDFSISFWMKTTMTGGTGQWWAGSGLVDGDVPDATNDFGVALVGSNVGFGIGNPDTTITSTTAVNDGDWHHVVATRSGAIGLIKLYVDGALQASGTAATATRSTPVTLTIGCSHSAVESSGSGNYFNGSIDEVRIYNEVVSAATVTQLYSRGQTLVAEYLFAGNAHDSSGFGNNGTINNNVTFVAGNVDPLAAQFDGLSSYIEIPVAAINDFSIAYWVKTTANGGSGQWWSGLGMVDGDAPGTANDFGTSLLGSRPAFGVGNPDTTITSSANINDGNWHHVAATRVSATGLMKLYVDGNLQYSATGPTNRRSASTGMRIGAIQSGGGFFPGAVDEVRVYNYQLNASQIASLVSPQPLPAPWTNTDIGGPAASPGYANYSNNSGVWTVGGGGSDVWSTTDQFQFAWTNFAGPGILQADLISAATISDGTTNENAKAGIMFRYSLATNAPFVALVHDQSQGVQFLYRDTTGAAAGQQGANIVINPAMWFRLVRSNNTFTAYYATSAGPPTQVSWIPIASHTTVMPNAALAGILTCSHAATKLASATYASVSISPPTAPTLLVPASQIINQNTTTGPLSASINDVLVPGSNLVLTATSSNTNLVPNANIVLGGSGNSRTVQITPAGYQSGATTITLIVNNGQPTANTTTNSFLVTVQTTTAGAWRQQYFGTTANAGNAADSADPTGDGMVNVMKRFFGLNPLVSCPASALPYPLLVNTNLTINYDHSLLATDLTWQVEWSPNLSDWLTNDIADLGVSTNGSIEVRQGSIPVSTADPLFLRIQVTLP
jgi:hypothetical protein